MRWSEKKYLSQSPSSSPDPVSGITRHSIAHAKSRRPFDISENVTPIPYVTMQL